MSRTREIIHSKEGVTQYCEVETIIHGELVQSMVFSADRACVALCPCVALSSAAMPRTSQMAGYPSKSSSGRGSKYDRDIRFTCHQTLSKVFL